MGCSSSSAQTISEENRPGVKERDTGGTTGESHFSHDDTTDGKPVLDQNQLPHLEPPPDSKMGSSVLMGSASDGFNLDKPNSDEQSHQNWPEVSVADQVEVVSGDLHLVKSAEAHKPAGDKRDAPNSASAAEQVLDSDLINPEPDTSDHIFVQREPECAAESELKLDRSLAELQKETTEEETGFNKDLQVIEEPNPASDLSVQEHDTISEPSGKEPGLAMDPSREQPGLSLEPEEKNGSAPEPKEEQQGFAPEYTADELGAVVEPITAELSPALETTPGDPVPPSEPMPEISSLSPETSAKEPKKEEKIISVEAETSLRESEPAIELDLLPTSEPVPEHTVPETTQSSASDSPPDAPEPQTISEPDLQPKLILQPEPEEAAQDPELTLVETRQEPAAVETSSDTPLSEPKQDPISVEVKPEETEPTEASG